MVKKFILATFFISIPSIVQAQNPICDSILLSTAPEFCLDTYTVALWHFNEGASDTVYDATNNNNDGMIYGATWVDGRFGKALDYNPADTNHVLVPNSSSLQITGPLTIEAWIKRDTVDVHHFILSKGGWHDSYELQILWKVPSEDNELRFILEGSTETALDSKTKIDTSKWTYVAATYDGVYMRVYVNALFEDSILFSGPINGTSSPVDIGRRDPSKSFGGHYFDGIIDEVRISNVARLPRGYINPDGLINISDIIYAVNYVFKDGPPPIPRKEIGDVNCDCKINLVDIIYLVNYVFKSGCKPCILLG